MHTVAVSYQQYLNRVMAFFAGVLALSAFLYGVFLLQTVVHAAARQTAEREIRTIEGALGGLESQYLLQNKNLTPQRAAELGFVTTKNVFIVYVGTGGLSFKP